MAIMYSVLSIVLLFRLISINEAIDTPDFLKICHTSDPNLSECLMRSAEALKPTLALGAPDYNIPSLEPLVMDELISEHSGGLTITATNVKAYGASNFFVKSLNVNDDGSVYDFDVELPNLRLEADYGVDGKIMLVPIKGNGPMTANVSDCTAKVILTGEKVETNGDTYLHFKTLSMKVKVGSGNGRLENLFNGDKVLGEIVNETINKNFDAFLKELLPVIEKSLSKVFLNIANNIVSTFKFSQLFPV